MKFELFQSSKKQKFYFYLKTHNDRILLSSQEYTTNNACKKEIKYIIEHSTDPVSFKRKKKREDLHSFHFLSPNGQPIAHSPHYENEALMEADIQAIMTHAAQATIVDQSNGDQ